MPRWAEVGQAPSLASGRTSLATGWSAVELSSSSTRITGALGRLAWIAARKRAQFIQDHGKLRCERCNMDPANEYGEGAGQTCIEVHHYGTQVSEMEPDHETSFTDLKCLCANCHRVLALGLPFEL